MEASLELIIKLVRSFIKKHERPCEVPFVNGILENGKNNASTCVYASVCNARRIHRKTVGGKLCVEVWNLTKVT